MHNCLKESKVNYTYYPEESDHVLARRRICKKCNQKFLTYEFKIIDDGRRLRNQPLKTKIMAAIHDL
jgi:transcriptional regulator NrdR family protein